MRPKKRPLRQSRVPGRVFQVLIALFLYAPIFIMIAFSFNASKSRTHWAGFTLQWYRDLFHDKLVLDSLYVTLALAVLSAIIATVIGTAAAVGIHAMKKRPKQIMLTANNIPMVNPDIITGVSFMLLFVVVINLVTVFLDWLREMGWNINANISLGFATLLIAHISFNIPYVILSVMPKLRQLNKHLYEAAMDLGASPFRAFYKVILPEIMPGVTAGLMIAFTMSIDDFVISYFTSGTEVQTLPVTIYAMTRKRISPEINALSTLMFLAVLLLLIVINVLQVRDADRQAKKEAAKSPRKAA